MQRNFIFVLLLSLTCFGFTSESFCFQRSGGSVSDDGAISVPPLTGLGRGINFGNMLEAPNEGDWGLFVEEEFFDLVVAAGFDHIRMPISWTHHADLSAPFLIEESFFQRVDWVVDQAVSRGLKIIVNNHHYDELNDDPNGEAVRALTLWQQIATRYQSEPVDKVYFEILNEPHGVFNDDPELWNQFMIDALAVIRQTNPTRKVVVGPTRWNSVYSLNSFSPPTDPNLLATVHFYAPFEFTHQGACWVDPTPPIGAQWHGDRVNVVGGLQNWSWNTTLEPMTGGLQVTYDAAWAGLQLHNPSGYQNVSEVRVTVSNSTNLRLIVWNNDSNNELIFSLPDSNGEVTHVVDVSSFNEPITNIILQNHMASPQPSLIVSEFEVRSRRRFSLIEDETQALRNALRLALIWSVRNKVPMYLGEFGAFEPGDFDSRVRWTTAVRETVEGYQFDWACWEFGAGFGIYDPAVGVWRVPLTQALIPEFQN